MYHIWRSETFKCYASKWYCHVCTFARNIRHSQPHTSRVIDATVYHALQVFSFLDDTLSHLVYIMNFLAVNPSAAIYHVIEWAELWSILRPQWGRDSHSVSLSHLIRTTVSIARWTNAESCWKVTYMQSKTVGPFDVLMSGRSFCARRTSQ